MTVLDYTTYDDIRAVLGVSDEELSDATIGLEVYSNNLTAELRDVAVGLPAKYTEVAAVTSKTDDQQYFYESTRNFAVYVVARQLTSSLPMFGPKEVGDSKTMMARFSDSPYKETIKTIKEMFDLNRSRVMTAYEAIAAAGLVRSTRVMFAVAKPSFDPVVG